MTESPRSTDTTKTVLLKTAVVLITTGSLGYLVSSWLGITDERKAVIVGLLMLFASLSRTFIKERLYQDLGRRYTRQHTGIWETFKNLEECTTDLEAAFREAKRVRLLLQFGRRELGASEQSSFYNLIKNGEIQSDATVQILRASPTSPFLSHERARERNGDYERWQKDIARLKGEIDHLQKTNHLIHDREHREPFLWRIFIFDDIAFVSAYLYPKDNDTRAPVYKLVEGGHSLFVVFDKYFDYLWRKYDPETGLSDESRWASWK